MISQKKYQFPMGKVKLLDLLLMVKVPMVSIPYGKGKVIESEIL